MFDLRRLSFAAPAAAKRKSAGKSTGGPPKDAPARAALGNHIRSMSDSILAEEYTNIQGFNQGCKNSNDFFAFLLIRAGDGPALDVPTFFIRRGRQADFFTIRPEVVCTTYYTT